MKQALLLGGGVAAFAAALDLAEVGVEVWIADTAIRVPERDVRDPGGEVAALLGEIAAPLTPEAHGTPGGAPSAVTPAQVSLIARDGAWRPLPESSVWGIPAVPLSRAALALFGAPGAFRAYLDRLKPVLTIGKERNLGKLVDSRVGRAVRETAVDPLVHERFGVRAHDAEVALVEQGLNEALTRAGSLSGGAMQQHEAHVARETVVAPAAGWHEFGELLVAHLELYGAKRFTSSVVSCARASSHGAGWTVTDAEGRRLAFDAVIGDLEDIARVAVNASGVADAGPTEGAADLVAALASLLPATTRQYADIGIQGESARSVDGQAPADDRLLLLETAEAGTWTARVLGGSANGSAIWLSGPAGPGDLQLPARLPADLLAGAIEAAGLGDVASEPVVRVRAAAFATIAERDAAELARAACAAAYPDLIVAGEQLHGGELGEALAEARQRAVVLRRKLTGISE